MANLIAFKMLMVVFATLIWSGSPSFTTTSSSSPCIVELLQGVCGVSPSSAPCCNAVVMETQKDTVCMCNASWSDPTFGKNVAVNYPTDLNTLNILCRSVPQDFPTPVRGADSTGLSSKTIVTIVVFVVLVGGVFMAIFICIWQKNGGGPIINNCTGVKGCC